MAMKLKSIIAVFLISLFLLACNSVPVTGRKQLTIIPSSELLAMSYQQYDEFLKQNPKSSDATNAAMVKKVGNNIKDAVEQYLNDNNKR